MIGFTQNIVSGGFNVGLIRMRIAQVFIVLAMLNGNALADAPCDFKGIAVGDVMTPKQIMSALGISNFKMNPEMPGLGEMHSLADKYGMVGASELVDWKTGPYCNDQSCRIPYGVQVGNKIPASVFVSFDQRSKQVQGVTVSINAAFWDDLVPIIKNKYVGRWDEEQTVMPIAKWNNPKSARRINREILTHRTGGTNERTGGKCRIFATNFDVIFEHPGALGALQSVVDIKLISTNF